MNIGIIGLPRSGKTTLFNAVTRGAAEVAAYQGAQGSPNMGVAKVPDGRLDRIAEVYEPKRVIPAEVSYVDIPGAPEGLGKAGDIAGEYLNHLQRTDILLVVARAFQDPSVVHVEDSIDASRDVETVLLELSFADIAVLDRRLARIEEGAKGAKAPEREALDRERSLLARIREPLEDGAPIREATMTDGEASLLEGFQFLTAKPFIVVANVGEERMSEAAELRAGLSSSFDGQGVRTEVLCGLLEMELAQMDPGEEQEFREGLGTGESGLDRMIALSYEVAGLVTFFTANQNEARAWAVPTGTTALKAAGKVHSDFEKGFIRAEVVAFDDLDDGGSIAEARRRGLLRQEGKGYVVQDGDILNILFNV